MLRRERGGGEMPPTRFIYHFEKGKKKQKNVEKEAGEEICMRSRLVRQSDSSSELFSHRIR